MSCSAQSRSRIKHLLCLCGFRKELVLIYPSILSFLLLHAWFRTLPQMDLYTARTVHLRQPQTWSASPKVHFAFLKVSHSCLLQGPSYCQFLHFQSRILSPVCALHLDCSVKFSCEGILFRSWVSQDGYSKSRWSNWCVSQRSMDVLDTLSL